MIKASVSRVLNDVCCQGAKLINMDTGTILSRAVSILAILVKNTVLLFHLTFYQWLIILYYPAKTENEPHLKHGEMSSKL